MPNTSKKSPGKFTDIVSKTGLCSGFVVGKLHTKPAKILGITVGLWRKSSRKITEIVSKTSLVVNKTCQNTRDYCGALAETSKKPPGKFTEIVSKTTVPGKHSSLDGGPTTRGGRQQQKKCEQNLPKYSGLLWGPGRNLQETSRKIHRNRK